MIPDPAVASGLEQGIARRDWHLKGVKRFPRRQRVFERDPGELVREWIVPGYAPKTGLLSAEDAIITIGSCFAGEVGDLLGGLGCSSGGFRAPFRVTHTFAILDFVSWCVTG